MINNPLVSVIIPAYNAEMHIGETIESVLNQTHSNLEVIVVDDGSTDKTSSLVEGFCKRDSRLKLFNQKNSGVSIARNAGFAASKGSFIAFLDADDLWTTKDVELKLKKFSSDATLGLVHSDTQVIDKHSNKKPEFYQGEEGYLLDNLLLGQREWVTGPSGSLVKREVVEAVGGFDSDLSNNADQEFFFRVASKYKIGRVGEVTWYYRVHPNNMHKNIDLLEKDALIAFQKADSNKLFKTKSFRDECFSNMYLMLAGTFWKSGGNKIKSIAYLLKSMMHYPPIALRLAKKILY